MTVDEAAGGEAVLEISERARAAVVEARAGQPEAERLALWLEVTGVSGPEYTYELYLLSLDEAEQGDVVQLHDDLATVVPEDSVDKVRGASIDLSEDSGQRGWVLSNPNRPPLSGPLMGIRPLSSPRPGESPSPAVGSRPPAHLSGDVAERVAQVLEQQINPMIAAHGGRADLVAVEEGAAYLRLSGGCQGCGMASVTLTQGVEVAIKEAVPEITSVVDVTDHASGANPYFESSKK
jgi:Fe/S biogenesis protein NfuA